MATQFVDIYNLNEKIREDNRLKAKPTNQIYKLYYDYLTYAISYFADDCYKDLNNLTAFSQQEYYFKTNGTDNQFLLLPTPPTNCLFYVGTTTDEDIGYTEVDLSNYSYNSTTNVLTISNPILAVGVSVYISGYIIGQFNSDLNNVEKVILAEGMNVPWSQEMLFRDKQMHQMVYGGSTKIYSQAQHISALSNIFDNLYYKHVCEMINDYTYKQNPNKNTDLGLSGKI